ncbi:uncharacterized protein LOC134288341 [Aedes albopictus]|uniref:Retrotransposon gag domain-containing protein n=1 Tax=Aedes albopictus TaxID=7160 RepID=A0ABM1Y4S8_AEDAL
MDFQSLLLQYRSMNTDHLLDDELEYELVIRGVEYSSGESRDLKKRKLRHKLKEQREISDFSMEVIDSEEGCKKELMQVKEKLTKIRDKLENSRTKKTDMSAVQTRLIHLYYRLDRLKDMVDVKGLEGEVLRLLSSSRNESRDAGQTVDDRISRNLMGLSIQENDDPGDVDWQEEDYSSGSTREDKRKKKVGRKKKIGKKAKAKAISPKKKISKAKSVGKSEEMLKKLIDHVDSYIEERLSRMSEERDRKSSGSVESHEDVHHVVQLGKKMGSREEKKQLRKERFVDSEFEEESVSEAESGSSRGLRRRPRSVADWKLRYDGKDDGKKLNKFIEEVEFMAEAEGLSKRMLFSEAIHLFAGDARTWYMDGKRNRDFCNWGELVAELKLEFQPPDMDFHYEQQAAQRRQRRAEKFQDYYNAVVEIFRYMAVPPSEERQFDIVFRNLRSDYKNVLVVKGVRTLKALRQWGRKLDAVNMWMYRGRDQESTQKPAQVHEVSAKPFQSRNQSGGKTWKAPDPPQSSREQNRPSWKRTPDKPGSFPSRKQSAPADGECKESQPESSRQALEKRVAEYKVPDRTTCFNCRGKFHYHSACLAPKEVFCTICGFHNYRRDNCPYCAKNPKGSA